MIGESEAIRAENDFLHNEYLLVGTRAFAFAFNRLLLLLLLLMNCNCLTLVPHPTIRRRQITFACTRTAQFLKTAFLRFGFALLPAENSSRAVPVVERQKIACLKGSFSVSLQMLTAMLDGKESDSHV